MVSQELTERRWYTSSFGRMVEDDCSNVIRSDLSVLNVLAATRYSRNWQVPARGRWTYSTMPFDSYHILCDRWPFIGWRKQFGRLEYSNLYLEWTDWNWCAVLFQPCCHMVHLRLGTDGPVQPYDRNSSRISTLTHEGNLTPVSDGGTSNQNTEHQQTEGRGRTP